MSDSIQWRRQYENIETGKRGYALTDVLPRTVVVDLTRKPQRIMRKRDTIFADVRAVDWHEFVTPEIEVLCEMETGQHQETLEEFADRFMDAFTDIVVEAWEPSKFHYIPHSSGYDSRLLSAIIRRLYEKRGPDWLGDVLFGCAEWEVPIFTHIMDYEGWNHDRRFVYREDCADLHEFWEEALDFDNAWENYSIPHWMPHNHILYPLRAAQRAGRVPKSDAQIQVIYNTVEIPEMLMVPGKNKLYDTLDLAYACPQAAQRIGDVNIVVPYTDLCIVQMCLETSNRVKAGWKPVVTRRYDDGLASFPNLYGYDDTWKMFPHRELSQRLLKKAMADYAHSWYGQYKPEALNSATATFAVSEWWGYWGAAVVCEHLIKSGYELVTAKPAKKEEPGPVTKRKTTNALKKYNQPVHRPRPVETRTHDKALVTAILLNYNRPENIATIVEALESQSEKVNVTVINNAKDPFASQSVHVPWNAGCYIRIPFALYADTDWVLFLDDDLKPTDGDFIRDAVATASQRPDAVTGAYGRHLSRVFPYYECDQSGPVEIVKGRLMLFRKDILSKVRLFSYPSWLPTGFGEDIHLCLEAGHGEPVHFADEFLRGRLADLPTWREGISRDTKTHLEHRNDVCRWYLTEYLDRKPAIVPYTANFGGYDVLQRTSWGEVCLTDNDAGLPPWWTARTPEHDETDARRTARRCKVLPHEHFPGCDYTIWHDGNISLLVDPVTLPALLGDTADMALFRHNERGCVYEEAEAVIRCRKDKAARVRAQMERYRAEGMPRDFGLHATWVLVRRNTAKVRDFCRQWWAEIEQGSARDQLSFDYVRWKMGMEVAQIPEDVYSSSLFEYRREGKHFGK